ncbi:MAG TPA: hypothetical protein DEP05_00895 [Betaproteobacteria bacterium]|nr:hypothetical protein [Betaproteobacteria bacterium]
MREGMANRPARHPARAPKAAIFAGAGVRRIARLAAGGGESGGVSRGVAFNRHVLPQPAVWGKPPGVAMPDWRAAPAGAGFFRLTDLTMDHHA